MLMKNRYPDGKSLMSIGVFGAMLLSVFGLSAVLCAPQAYAEDQKVYDGTECRAYYPADAARLITTDFGLFAGQNEVFINCPIVRDNISNLNGTKAAVVSVFNRNIDGLVGCTLWSNSDNGGNVVKTAAVAQSFQGQQQLNVDVNASLNSGYYHLVCYLPPGSGILSYRINEY